MKMKSFKDIYKATIGKSIEQEYEELEKFVLVGTLIEIENNYEQLKRNIWSPF